MNGYIKTEDTNEKWGYFFKSIFTHNYVVLLNNQKLTELKDMESFIDWLERNQLVIA